jgi:penicillin-binding protein 1A
VAERDLVWSRGGVPIEELPDPFAPPPTEEHVPGVDEGGEAPEQPRKRRRWPMVLYSIAGLILVTLLWLVITAPLSRALGPHTDPGVQSL